MEPPGPTSVTTLAKLRQEFHLNIERTFYSGLQKLSAKRVSNTESWDFRKLMKEFIPYCLELRENMPAMGIEIPCIKNFEPSIMTTGFCWR